MILILILMIMGTNNSSEAGGLAQGLDIDDPIARDIGQPLFLSLSSFAMEKAYFSLFEMEKSRIFISLQWKCCIFFI